MSSDQRPTRFESDDVSRGFGEVGFTQAREKRKRNDADRFSLLVASVRDYAIFMLDPSGAVTTWNAGAERIKQYSTDEIIGRHFSVFYPPDVVATGMCERELETAAIEGRFEDEGWRVRRDGSRFWANVVITALRDEEGTLVGYGKVTRDLTERRRAEQQRLAAEERFRRLIEGIKDYAVFILDPTGHVTTWNTGAERIKGYRADEIIGRHFSVFYPDDEMRSGKCQLELEGAARDGRFEDEGWRIRKDGSRFWANVVIGAIRDEAGNLVGFSKITRDLTDRVRSEEERAARLAAEEATRLKDQFLAMLGHELRNPLAPIVTALQLIKLRGDARLVREHEIIERQVRHLNRLVDDLLDISRITQGKIELKHDRFDIRTALANAVEIATPMFDKRNQRFEVETPSHALIVDGDEARMVQVFANLLDNASKFTHHGGRICLIVRTEGDRLAIEVRDEGPGIPAEMLPRIFELFVQGQQDSARSRGGLGLGLALVHKLVALHGGEVEARSTVGVGSSFVVRLPAVDATPPTVQHDDVPADRLGADGLRILVVDDNDDARIMLGELLQSLGHDVKTAADGIEALAQLETFGADVAVLDIGLPNMDGHQLAERIRTTEKGRRIRLIALTGYGQTQDHARSKDAGFDAHLVKPVETKRLIQLLRPATS